MDLDPLRLVLLGTALEVAVFEVPTGVFTGGALTIPLGLVFAMPEHNFRPSPREGRSSVQHSAATAHCGGRLARSRPVLLILLAAELFSGTSQEGQSMALGEASAGPVIGAIGNLFGVRRALTVAASILSPTLLLYARAIQRRGAEPGLKDKNAPE